METNAYLGVFEDIIRQRQHALMDRIMKLYEIEDSENAQIRTWINQGCIMEKASTIKHIIPGRLARDAPHDDRPNAHPHS